MPDRTDLPSLIGMLLDASLERPTDSDRVVDLMMEVVVGVTSSPPAHHGQLGALLVRAAASARNAPEINGPRVALELSGESLPGSVALLQSRALADALFGDCARALSRAEQIQPRGRGDFATEEALGKIHVLCGKERAGAKHLGRAMKAAPSEAHRRALQAWMDANLP